MGGEGDGRWRESKGGSEKTWGKQGKEWERSGVGGVTEREGERERWKSREEGMRMKERDERGEGGKGKRNRWGRDRNGGRGGGEKETEEGEENMEMRKEREEKRRERKE